MQAEAAEKKKSNGASGNIDETRRCPSLPGEIDWSEKHGLFFGNS
jgi:hypothetical protein